MRNAVRVLCFAIAAFAAIDAPLRAAPAMPSIDATAAPTPTGALLRFAGQVLDLRSGFVFFTTGDGFALDPQYRTLDASTGAPSTQPVVTGMYASAAFDPQTGNVVELSVSQKPLPPSAAMLGFRISRGGRALPNFFRCQMRAVKLP